VHSRSGRLSAKEFFMKAAISVLCALGLFGALASATANAQTAAPADAAKTAKYPIIKHDPIKHPAIKHEPIKHAAQSHGGTAGQSGSGGKSGSGGGQQAQSGTTDLPVPKPGDYTPKVQIQFR
jgi:hypothetical protein